MVQTGDPIAILYSSSPLEKHHFDQACLILQQKQNDIFSNLELEKHKAVDSILGFNMNTYTPFLDLWDNGGGHTSYRHCSLL